MPKLTVVCYVFSLIFYGMGYWKTRAINNAFTEQLTTYDVTLYISLATTYFVLAIFFALIGSVIFCCKYLKDPKNDRVTGILEPKTQITKSKYNLDLYRRIS